MRFFRKRSDSFQKETRTILEQLQCECTVFSDDSILDEVRDAYKKASKLGKSEGFIPILIIPSIDLLEQRLGDHQLRAVLKKAVEELLEGQEKVRKKNNEIILAKIPVKHPWEIFSCLPVSWWKNYKEELDFVSQSKKWYDSYGAVPAVFSSNVIEFYQDSYLVENGLSLTQKTSYSKVELNTKRGGKI